MHMVKCDINSNDKFTYKLNKLQFFLKNRNIFQWKTSFCQVINMAA